MNLVFYIPKTDEIVLLVGSSSGDTPESCYFLFDRSNDPEIRSRCDDGIWRALGYDLVLIGEL